ncbi:hypothetical protein CVU76_02905 [Candidatus Dojkabacteria bacterium HGW-Dojkabacteria-1]|uniref:Type II secretion system protein n=1 Tax=Candidatus Dojkabacteria bacterium HGW-Dojkabacteria-1 TaxID=2013761 RepID=A0A2N2F442_9BACT|nr:MAG: hypothetical protein CVU76_02905 [Candidatus Dojkabacteria bacterium HGW-Dojkabacteria-1]
MKNRLKGITLIESLVYIGLFAIIIIMILNFMLSAQESTLRNIRKSNLHHSSTLVVQHFEESFNSALRVNDMNSVFEDDNGRLELISEVGAKQYSLINSRLYYDGVAITPPSISVTRFYLEPVYQGKEDILGVILKVDLISNKDNSLSERINMLFTIR